MAARPRRKRFYVDGACREALSPSQASAWQATRRLAYEGSTSLGQVEEVFNVNVLSHETWRRDNQGLRRRRCWISRTIVLTKQPKRHLVMYRFGLFRRWSGHLISDVFGG